MLAKIMDALRRWLYPAQFEMEPGRFESFLTGVSELPLVPPVRVAARPRLRPVARG